MLRKDFSVGDALSYGWQMTKKHLGFLLVMMLCVIVISAILGGIERAVMPKGMFFWQVLELAVHTFIGMGIIAVSLVIYKHINPEAKDFFAPFPYFFQYLIATLLYGLIVLGGLILLIVPGIIWALKFQFFGYFIVEEGTGPLDALHKSSVLTNGVKWQLFFLSLAVIGINILGVLCLFVGVFVSLPITLMAYVYVYKKLRGEVIEDAAVLGEGEV